jgi:hypothetical protein
MKNRYLKVAHFSETKFRILSKCFSQDLPATTASLFCNLNRNTVQRVYTLLRHRLEKMSLQDGGRFAGEVEVDASEARGTRNAILAHAECAENEAVELLVKLQ